jgi:phosphodiesterase/alkaline phosphatase D-like protein
MGKQKVALTRRQFLVRGVQTSAALILGRRCVSRPTRPTGTFVLNLWAGGLTANSIRVNARLDHDSEAVRVVASLDPGWNEPVYSGYGTADLATNNRMVSLAVNGLQADSAYYYGIEADGVLDGTTTGRFRTAAEGPFSFSFAFASCAETGSNHPVFETIRQLNPLFFVHMGDFHYLNIGVNERQVFREGYETVLASPGQSALYRETPIAYMWDDHDYGPNDSDQFSPGREAARLTYQEYVPHYPLAAGSGNVPIYQAFTIGRVRFIMTDTRSERDGSSVPADDPNKSMMGVAQKGWWKQEVLNAQGVYPVIVWVSTSPWLADSPGSGVDNWNGFRAERRELADWLVANQIQNLFFISGDVHMVAIEDGRNNRYASNGERGFPIMQAAAMDRSGSQFESNSYSEGQYPGGGRFGVMTITDDGGEVVGVEWSGRLAGNEEIVRLELTAPPSPRLEVQPVEGINLVAQVGGPTLLSGEVTIGNGNVGVMGWTVVAEPAVPWLSFTPDSGETVYGEPATVVVTADPAGLAFGTYQTTLRIEAPGATDGPVLLPVTLLYTEEAAVFLPGVFTAGVVGELAGGFIRE